MKRPLLAITMLVSLALTGCTAQQAGAVDVEILTHFRDTALPQRDGNSSDMVPTIYWTDSTRATVGLTTYGSSSCPLYPTRLTVVADNRIELLMKTYTGACTADLGPYTSEFTLPDSVSRRVPVTVTLDSEAGANTMLTNLRLRPSPTASANDRFRATD